MHRRAGVIASAKVAAGGGGITKTFQQSAVSATDASSYSFPPQPIGAASATRRVVIDVSIRTGAVTAVTIGGVTATQVVAATSSSVHTSQWSAVVPSGTTATVDVTCSATSSACGIGVWTLSHGDPTGQTASDTASTANPSLTVTTNPGDIVIGSCSYRGGSVTWAAATERYDEQMDTSVRVHAGADMVASGASVDMSLSIASFSISSAACAAGYA